MTKDELIGTFRTSHNNCMLAYVAMILLGYEGMGPLYIRMSSLLSIPKAYDDMQVVALLGDLKLLSHGLGQLYRTVHRAALKEMFEITKSYCEETRQVSLLTAQPWYQFWRILRNCLSHDFQFHFNEYDKAKLPVSWSGVTLDLSLAGKDLTFGVLNYEKLRQLLDEVKLFVEQKIT